MRKMKICALGVCICVAVSLFAGCGRDEYSAGPVVDEINRINSEKARMETEEENAETARRAEAIARAKAEALEIRQDSEPAQNGDVWELTVASTKRLGIGIPTYIRFPEQYDAEEFYPMVIMFAGFSSAHDNGTRFNPVADEIVKNQLIVVQYDNPGYGNSEEDNLSYTLTNIKNDALDVINYMTGNYNIGKVGAFGYDVGGRVIMEMQVDGMYDFDQIELLAPYSETSEFIHACFDKVTWENLKNKAEADGTVWYGQQVYSKQWFLDWESKEETLTEDFIKNYKGRRCMLVYSQKDENVNYYTMVDLAQTLGCAAIEIDDGHDLGVRGWDSTRGTQRTVRLESANFMATLKDN